VDLLVLSAGPAATPLRLGPLTTERARAFVDASLAASLLPLASLTEVLAKEATVVGMSSAYVSEAPPDFSHYAAAKAAVEGLLGAYGREHPGRTVLLARPPRVLTDVTNTPFGKEDVLPAERVAAAIVRAVVDARARKASGGSLGPLVLQDFALEPTRTSP
jgi:NAD(P)-dependent dehydrogenase (short-subunit alcohol dehydrogenase family)